MPPTPASAGANKRQKVLVLCATGKAGKNISLALKDAGFEVYGTTRKATEGLSRMGITPIVANYTVRADLDRAFAESGAKRVVVLTDFFAAAGKSVAREVEQGKIAFDAAKAAGVEHLVFMSAIDAELFPAECTHIHAKVILEQFLKTEAGLPFSILRPCAFFENFDDPANHNPLKKGRLSFLSTESVPFCATYDIGRAAAAQLKQPSVWLGKTLDVISWKGSLTEAAAALEKVGGVPVKHGLAMPLWLRRLLVPDLHHMCLYFEAGNVKSTPEQFKKVVPGALSAEDWFRRHNRYSNGEPIVPANGQAPLPVAPSGLAAFGAPALGIAVLASFVWLGVRYVNHGRGY